MKSTFFMIVFLLCVICSYGRDKPTRQATIEYIVKTFKSQIGFEYTLKCDDSSSTISYISTVEISEQETLRVIEHSQRYSAPGKLEKEYDHSITLHLSEIKECRFLLPVVKNNFVDKSVSCVYSSDILGVVSSSTSNYFVFDWQLEPNLKNKIKDAFTRLIKLNKRKY